MTRNEIIQEIERLQDSKKGKGFAERLEIAKQIDELMEQLKTAK